MSLTIETTALPDPPSFSEFIAPANLLGGYFQITSNPARIELLYGRYGAAERLPQVDLPPGSYSVGRSPSGDPLVGIRAQNASAGIGATLGGYFWTESDPTLSFIGVASSQVAGTVVIPVVQVADFPPADPSDGSLIILDLGTVRWMMEFDSAAGNWQFAGGPPLISEVATPQSTASAAYTNLATVGPSIILPRDGTYDYEWACEQADHSGGTATYGVGLFVNGVLQGEIEQEIVNTGSPHIGSMPAMVENENAGLLGQTALLQYKVSGGTITFGQRKLKLWPRVLT